MNCIWVYIQEPRGHWLSRDFLWPWGSGPAVLKPTRSSTESRLQNQTFHFPYIIVITTISKNALSHLYLKVVFHFTNTFHSLIKSWEISAIATSLYSTFTGFLHLLISTIKDPECLLFFFFNTVEPCFRSQVPCACPLPPVLQTKVCDLKCHTAYKNLCLSPQGSWE